MLRTFLVRSATLVLIRALSSIIKSMGQFIASAVILSKVTIFRFIVFSIVCVNIFCNAVNCASVAGLIPSSNNSFMVLNRLVWSSMREFSVSSAMMASRVELVVSLEVGLALL